MPKRLGLDVPCKPVGSVEGRPVSRLSGTSEVLCHSESKRSGLGRKDSLMPLYTASQPGRRQAG